MQNEGYSTPASMVVFPVVLFVFLLIIARYRLYTSVTYDSVTVKMIWRRRVVTISNIESVAVERFEMRKWQGYIRYRGSWCYISNAADKGLWITLKKGKPFMVSSATPEEFERAVNSARKLHRSQTSMD
jgi:hypothetical protein